MHTCCCTKVYSKGLTQIPAIIKVHYNYIHKHLSVYLCYCSNLTSASPRYNHTHISMANRLHINYTILPFIIVNGWLYNRHLYSLHANVNMFNPSTPTNWSQEMMAIYRRMSRKSAKHMSTGSEKSREPPSHHWSELHPSAISSPRP